MKGEKGFTLIELLVVVAIIGLLSTLATAYLGGARAKARDTRRLSDLKQLRTALEMYNDENHGYPAENDVLLGGTNFACLNKSGFHVTGCADSFMGKIPSDPLNYDEYVYTYISTNPSTYSVTARLEGAMQGLSGDITLTPSELKNN